MIYFLYLTIAVTFLSIKVNAQCDGLGDGFHAHSSQCDRYIECRGGKLVEEGLCPDGLVFNNYGYSSKNPRCELPFGVDCTGREQLQPAQPTDQCPRRYGMFRNPGDCEKYIHCDDGIPFVGSCPTSLAFNDYYGICDWPDNVQGCASARSADQFSCPEFDAASYSTQGDPRFPDSNDCRKLFVCIAHNVNGVYTLKPRHLSCEFGRVFNAKKNECDEAENVEGCEKYYENEKYSNAINDGVF